MPWVQVPPVNMGGKLVIDRAGEYVRKCEQNRTFRARDCGRLSHSPVTITRGEVYASLFFAIIGLPPLLDGFMRTALRFTARGGSGIQLCLKLIVPRRLPLRRGTSPYAIRMLNSVSFHACYENQVSAGSFCRYRKFLSEPLARSSRYYLRLRKSLRSRGWFWRINYSEWRTNESLRENSCASFVSTGDTPTGNSR